ncbi:MAG: GNAT family N-acetyltransferase, partial [Acidobacteria bacterium]|nr:GNAT family N-acetyltransferase [Acidobacteriota bacterium]
SVLHLSYLEYESSFTSEGFAFVTPSSDQIQNRMIEGPVWIALLDNAICGTVSVLPKGESLYIRSMAILPLAREYKIGELLMENIERFAFAKGYKHLFLSTTPFLNRATRLYESCGFQRGGEGPYDLFGTPLFTMEKVLVKEES